MKKNLLLNNFGLFFSAIEKALINFKSRLLHKKIDKIQTRKPTPELATEPTKRNKKSSLKLQQQFINERIAGEKI